jgi:group II intron reverse transcriptase/maturase
MPRKTVAVETQRSTVRLPHLQRINVAARRAAKTRFTALLHHVDEAALLRAFLRQKRSASAGIDGMTFAMYEANLAGNLQCLHARIHAGLYQPKPVRRAYIPKADGTKRPLGIPTLEDKIVQGAVAEVLSAIYEADFLGFSYGFRPNRSPHNALTSLQKAVMTQRVTIVLDADIRRFFDSVDHQWLMRILAHRIADLRVLRLIRSWLEAGVLESGTRCKSIEGTPQGSGISPLLANVFLHYVLDLWFHQWRRRSARGRAIIVRYADDFVMGFEDGTDARQMHEALKKRLAHFGLTLHETKTRLIEFGRLPAIKRRQQAAPRPETFSFLGFTHYCGWTRDGRFMMKCKTQRERLVSKLKALRAEAWPLMHASLEIQHRWLCRVLHGHFAYYGRPHNLRALELFLQGVRRIWHRLLRRRSQKSRNLSWNQFVAMTKHFTVPKARIVHPW